MMIAFWTFVLIDRLWQEINQGKHPTSLADVDIYEYLQKNVYHSPLTACTNYVHINPETNAGVGLGENFSCVTEWNGGGKKKKKMDR